MDTAINTPRAKSAEEKFCTECGSIIRLKAEICPSCGVRQMDVPTNTTTAPAGEQRSKTTAALLAFFLGGFGLHKFYLGQTGKGVLYLLFCWTFIPTLISMIEGVVLFWMNETRFQQKYARV